MTVDEDPLLARRDTDDQEEDALLTGEPTRKHHRGLSFWKSIGLFTWALLATLVALALAVFYHRQLVADSRDASKPTGKRNLIMMVSDGMGPTSLSLTRSYLQYRQKAPWSRQLVLDKHLIGQSRTRSTSSLVTDSAAGATAFSCGQKSYNGAISVLDDYSPCGTVLEAAKKAGYMTGLVVTTRITDATPATFAAHVRMRSEEDSIAEQMVGEHPLGQVVDLMLGGGRCHFLPNSTADSCREDSRDIVALAKDKGFSYLSTRKEFDDLKLGKNVKLPVLGLFAPTDIPYEIDRRFENDVYPSLDEMAKTALKALSEATKNSDKGFFLMIEGSRIDHAGHANDPAAQVHEVLAYDDAFSSVLKFLKKDSTPGVMVATSDHETGGLAVARQLHPEYPDYLWYPEVLTNVSHSAERLARDYFNKRLTEPNADFTAYIKDVVHKQLAVHDASPHEISLLVDHPETAPYTFADIVSRRAQTGWSTHGHSAADVNIYASCKHAASPLIGNHENTEVGTFLRDYLDVGVDSITKQLKAASSLSAFENWLGPVPAAGQRLDGQDHLDHYQGDFKKHKRCEICAL